MTDRESSGHENRNLQNFPPLYPNMRPLDSDRAYYQAKMLIEQEYEQGLPTSFRSTSNAIMEQVSRTLSERNAVRDTKVPESLNTHDFETFKPTDTKQGISKSCSNIDGY
jgi:hypothetical protein